MAGERVGLVLAGGGARGAYELGALSVLLPALEARGERPTVLVGTSVGAINVAHLAANAHLGAGEAVAGGVELWSSLRWEQVLAPLLGPSMALRGLSYVGDVLGVPRARLNGLLDTTPLREMLRRVIDFERLRRNVEAGLLHAGGGRRYVCGDEPQRGVRRRAIGSVGGRRPGHRLRPRPAGRRACACLGGDPAPVPGRPCLRALAGARMVRRRRGARLNAPIRPALSLGAERIVVIGLNAVTRPPARLASDDRSDAFEVAGVFFEGALVSPLVQDVRTLARVNRLLGNRGDQGAAPDGWRYRRVPFIFISSPCRRRHLPPRGANFRAALRGPRGVALARLAPLARLIGGAGPGHGELLSYLFFAPEFATALIELGARDARRWLAAHSGPGGPGSSASTIPTPSP